STPPPDARVPVQCPQQLSTVTAPNGDYSLIVDEPGDFVAAVQSADGAAQFLERKVTIPDVPSFVLDLAMAGAAVSGIVVDKDTERPIAGALVQLAGGEGSGVRA